MREGVQVLWYGAANQLGMSFAIMMRDKTIRAANERLAGARVEVFVSAISTATDFTSQVNFLGARKAVDIAYPRNQFNKALETHDNVARDYASQTLGLSLSQTNQSTPPRLKDTLRNRSTKECVEIIVGRDNERLVNSVLKEQFQVNTLAPDTPVAEMKHIRAGRKQMDDFTEEGGLLLDTATRTVIYSENGSYRVMPAESLGFRTKTDSGIPVRVTDARDENHVKFKPVVDETGSLTRTGKREFKEHLSNPTRRSVSFEEHHDSSQALLKDAHSKLATSLDRMNDPQKSITERSKIASKEVSRAGAHFAGLTRSSTKPLPTGASAMPTQLEYSTAQPQPITTKNIQQQTEATDGSIIEVDVKAVVAELESSKSLVSNRGAYSVDRENKRAHLLVRTHPDDPKNLEVVALEVPYTDKLQRIADEFSNNPENPLKKCSTYQSMVHWELAPSSRVKVVKQPPVAGNDSPEVLYAVTDMSKEDFDDRVVKGWESELTGAAKYAVEMKHNVELGEHFLETTQMRKAVDQAEAILNRNSTEAEMSLRTRQSITSTLRSIGSLTNQTKQHAAEVLTSELSIDQEIRNSIDKVSSAMQQQLTQTYNQIAQTLEGFLALDAAKNALQVARSSITN